MNLLNEALPAGRLLRRCDQAFALGALAGQAHGLGLLASPLLGGLLVVDVPLHFAERALTLHLLLERLEGLVDVVVADENLNQSYLSCRSLPPGPLIPWKGRRRANKGL